MNSTTVIQQAKLASWADIIKDQKESSLGVAEWCNVNQISRSQFYYWRRRLQDNFVDSSLPDIVQISVPSKETCCETFKSFETFDTDTKHPSVTIRIDELRIEIPENISDSFLKRIIKAVRHA